jgi:hypothetical protein
VSSGVGSHLLKREGSNAATCPAAPDPLGGLQSTASPVAPDLASLWGGLRAATRPATLCGSWAISVNKSLTDLPIQ